MKRAKQNQIVVLTWIVIVIVIGLVSTGASLFAADDVVSAVEGTVKKVDKTAKTVSVTAADGTEHTFHLVERTTMHGAAAAHRGSEAAARDLTEGSRVVVHYTKKGSEETAEEIDHVGKDGLKTSEGAVTRFDRTAKTMSIKTADGTEETYRLTDHAARDAGRDTDDAAKKSAHVVVYYSEDAGHKLAHFFESH
jgi:hypothetical protein